MSTDSVMESDDANDISESVIAAYIRRFRNQAPTPSDNRRQIPSGTFWWLDESDEMQRAKPKPLTIAAEESYGGSYLRQLQKSLESDDEMTSRDEGIYVNNSRQRRGRSTESSYDKFNIYDSSRYRQRSEASVQLEDSDLAAAANLDNYAEKLLMKCDLLLKGYTSAKDSSIPRGISKRPNTFSGFSGADDSGRRYTTSKETLSDDSNSNERAIRGIKSRSTYMQYEEEFDRQESLSKFCNASKHESISPLEMTLAVSDDSWAELFSKRNVASPARENRNIVTGNDFKRNAQEMNQLTENEELSDHIGSREVMQEVKIIDPIQTSIVHTHSPNLFNAKSSARRDSIHNTSDSINSTLAVSIPPSSSPSTSRRKAEGGNQERLSLYLSSSSELDFNALARRANQEGGESTRASSRGECSLDSSYYSVDRITVEDSHVLERVDEDDMVHAHHCVEEVEEVVDCEADEGRSDDIVAATAENEGLPTSPSNDSVNDAVGVAVSVVPEVGTDHVLDSNTDQQQTGPQTHTQEQTLTRQGPHISALTDTAAPLPRLTEEEVAPYLNDEVTSLLWKRLCVVRNILNPLGSH